MADNESEDGAAGEPKPKSKLKLIIIAVVAVAVLGGGAWFMFLRSPKEVHVEAPKAKPPTFIDVPEILVNLAGQPGERVQYLKAKIVLEVKDPLQAEQIKPTLPRVNDMFQTYLRELRASDLNGSVGMFRLKEELTKRVNAAIAPGEVSAVLFKEILVQ
jgi:flagellar FliL protein